mmetsp:Transcript_33172/g.83640  ORF Transcript_33172/g.83640 Transcript_33172/m.83640 type:complete len:377 (+) Transcript_33172:289-1419(+)
MLLQLQVTCGDGMRKHEHTSARRHRVCTKQVVSSGGTGQHVWLSVAARNLTGWRSVRWQLPLLHRGPASLQRSRRGSPRTGTGRSCGILVCCRLGHGARQQLRLFVRGASLLPPSGIASRIRLELPILSQKRLHLCLHLHLRHLCHLRLHQRRLHAASVLLQLLAGLARQAGGALLPEHRHVLRLHPLRAAVLRARLLLQAQLVRLPPARVLLGQQGRQLRRGALQHQRLVLVCLQLGPLCYTLRLVQQTFRLGADALQRALHVAALHLERLAQHVQALLLQRAQAGRHLLQEAAQVRHQDARQAASQRSGLQHCRGDLQIRHRLDQKLLWAFQDEALAVVGGRSGHVHLGSMQTGTLSPQDGQSGRKEGGRGICL